MTNVPHHACTTADPGRRCWSCSASWRCRAGTTTPRPRPPRPAPRRRRRPSRGRREPRRRSPGRSTVFAAASLTDAFNEIGTAFTAANPDADVDVQLRRLVDDLVDADQRGRPGRRVRLGRPEQHEEAHRRRQQRRRAGDLRHQPARDHRRARATRRASPASPTWPTPTSSSSRATPRCRAARTPQQIFTDAGVTVTPKSLEENVKARRHQGDRSARPTPASCTPPTSSPPATRPPGVEIPDDINVDRRVPDRRSPSRRTNPATAQAFIDFVLSDAGQQILATYGFTRPMSRRWHGRHDRAPAGASRSSCSPSSPSLFFALPFLGLLWRLPWSDAWDVRPRRGRGPHRAVAVDPCSLSATALSLVFGVPLAWVLARVEFPGRGVVRALCTLSMVLPPVVGGVALFFSLGRRGLFGQYLDRWFGFRLPFTTWGVDRRPDVRRHAVPRAHGRGVAAPVRRPLRGRGPHARRVALVRVPPRHAAGDPARRWSPAPCSRGPGRSASSAPRSRSPATSPARRRRCRWRSTSSSTTPGEGARAQPGADRRLVRRARRPPRPLARRRRPRHGRRR